MSLHILAGQRATESLRTNIQQLISAYYTHQPDSRNSAQRVAFGTSGHRGSSLDVAFNENHIFAVAQAIAEYRQTHKVTGPLFIGMDTHALSEPALRTALQVFAAHGMDVYIQENGGYTPTPVISHAILAYNKGRSEGLADGFIITPSHNPPGDGGIKYNPPNGGPAGSDITRFMQERANELLETQLAEVQSISFDEALKAPTTHAYDYITPYVNDLDSVIDMEAIRKAGLKIGVDPMGGAGIAYWEPIAKKYGLDIEVVNDSLDPAFMFMCVDRDGKIRMDCSSPYAMAGLIELKDQFDIAFGNDPDYDRHGIVTKSSGLLNTNHYLAVAIHYLFTHRPQWAQHAAIGKTLVSSSMIDRVVAHLDRNLAEVPVGFKWFVDGLFDGSYGFGGEESAGASFLRKDGSVWTTDKDGIILVLLAAEITAVCGKDPGQLYQELEAQFGAPVYDRIDAPASPEQKKALKALSPEQVTTTTLAGETITAKLTHAPANGASLGGLKVATENGWFAARPSGTENIYKIYAESFTGPEHLQQLLHEAQAVVSAAFVQAGASI